MKTRHILLTTDLSAESRRAYGPISELATTLGARVTLLHVIILNAGTSAVEPAGTLIGTSDPTQEIENAKGLLEREVEHLSPDLELGRDVMVGTNVAETVTRYAKDNAVDMIAFSSHGRSGLRRLLLGSVAESILRIAHVPLLLYPPEE